MRWRIKTLMIVVAWSALFLAAQRLNRPDELFGWVGAAFATFLLTVPTVILGLGFLLANIHETRSSSAVPRWVAEAKERRDDTPG